MNATTEEAPKASPVPRGPSPENQARLDYIVQRAASEPGVTSPTIAKELEIGTLACGQLADRLVRKGEIQLYKVGSLRTYYPAGYDLSSIPAEPPAEPKPKKSKKEKAAEPEA